MNFLEKDLEDIIFDNAQTLEGIYQLKERGLPITGIPYRQVNFGSYGIADLITVTTKKEIDGDGTRNDFVMGYQSVLVANVMEFTIYELKKDEVNVGTLKQALNYAKAIKLAFSDSDISLSRYPNIKIVLIGNTVEKSSSFVYMPDFFNNLSIYTYEYAINGIAFKEHSEYRQTKETGLNAAKLTGIIQRDIRKIINAERIINNYNYNRKYNKAFNPETMPF